MNSANDEGNDTDESSFLDMDLDGWIEKCFGGAMNSTATRTKRVFYEPQPPSRFSISDESEDECDVDESGNENDEDN